MPPCPVYPPLGREEVVRSRSLEVAAETRLRRKRPHTSSSILDLRQNAAFSAGDVRARGSTALQKAASLCAQNSPGNGQVHSRAFNQTIFRKPKSGHPAFRPAKSFALV